MRAVRTASDGSEAAAPVGIAPDVVRWQRVHGRHDLPWQAPPVAGSLQERDAAGDVPEVPDAGEAGDPYFVWLSEVMLQQTQVATVIPYFNAFVAAFPTVAELAAAPLDRVMSLWSGLGYYSRARNLHRAAQLVIERYGGVFPSSVDALAQLPGVGQSTAAAIAVFGFGERAAILDGNVKRVFSRVFAVEGYPGQAAVARRLWAHAKAELPPPGASAGVLRAYTQGLMDLGATLCTRTRPACQRCPLSDKCVALREDAVSRFPAARPRRTVPIRAVEMLLLVSRGAVLIEQRPPTGVWGGLWSLPELAVGIETSTESLVAAIHSATGLALPATTPYEFARFDHALTHFRMQVRVWRVDLDQAQAHGQTIAALRQAATTRWLMPAEAGAAALPRPVKSLLQGIAASGIELQLNDGYAATDNATTSPGNDDRSRQ